MMKPNVILTTSSLVTILLVTFHLTDDIVRQMEPGNLSNLVILVLIPSGSTALSCCRDGDLGMSS